MIHELRIYHALPGRMPALNNRFANLTLGLFKKHGIEVVGFWMPYVGGANNQLIYILGFKDLAHREQAWDAFQADPEWIQGRAESEKDGAMISHLENILMRPTNYSPMQ